MIFKISIILHWCQWWLLHLPPLASLQVNKPPQHLTTKLTIFFCWSLKSRGSLSYHSPPLLNRFLFWLSGPNLSQVKVYLSVTRISYSMSISQSCSCFCRVHECVRREARCFFVHVMQISAARLSSWSIYFSKIYLCKSKKNACVSLLCKVRKMLFICVKPYPVWLTKRNKSSK